MGFMSKKDQQAKIFGDKLEYLFKHVRPVNGKREYTLEQVAEGTRQLGLPVSASYIAKLRKGKVSNPGIEVVQALSAFFGVGVEYWFSPDTTIPDSAQHTSELAVIHRKLDEANYSPQQIEFIARMLDMIDKLYGQTGTEADEENRPS